MLYGLISKCAILISTWHMMNIYKENLIKKILLSLLVFSLNLFLKESHNPKKV